MTTYQCDTCEGETPGGAPGTSFLVKPDGRTFHFCSSACIRAFVNNGSVDRLKTARWVIVAAFLYGGVAAVLIQKLVSLHWP